VRHGWQTRQRFLAAFLPRLAVARVAFFALGFLAAGRACFLAFAFDFARGGDFAAFFATDFTLVAAFFAAFFTAFTAFFTAFFATFAVFFAVVAADLVADGFAAAAGALT